MSPITLLLLLGCSVIQADPKQQILIVSQQPVPEVVLKAIGAPDNRRNERIAALSDWKLAKIKDDLALLIEKDLPLLVRLEREAGALKALKQFGNRPLALEELSPSLQSFVKEQADVMGLRKVVESGTKFMFLTQVTASVQHDNGTFPFQIRSNQPDMQPLLTGAKPNEASRPTGGLDLQANPYQGLQFRAVGERVTAPAEMSRLIRLALDFLDAQVVGAMAERDSLWKELGGNLPQGFSELSEGDRASMEDGFVSSFRAFGYATREEAELAWQRRKGFRTTNNLLLAIATVENSKPTLNMVGISRSRG